MKRAVAQKRFGYTLVEVVLAALILTVLARALVESSSLMSRLTSTGNVETVLQIESEKALDRIIADLRRSGFVSVDGRNYPYVFDDGDAQAPFDEYDHDRALQEAEEGDSDYGKMREIVFVLPADSDADGRPDLDEGAVLSWAGDEVSYTVATYPDGNFLLRRANLGEPDRIARYIERIVFDTPSTSGWEIPLNAVRVQVFLRMRDPNGNLYRYRNSVVLSLRNGDIE